MGPSQWERGCSLAEKWWFQGHLYGWMGVIDRNPTIYILFRISYMKKYLYFVLFCISFLSGGDEESWRWFLLLGRTRYFTSHTWVQNMQTRIRFGVYRTEVLQPVHPRRWIALRREWVRERFGFLRASVCVCVCDLHVCVSVSVISMCVMCVCIECNACDVRLCKKCVMRACVQNV